MILIGDEGAVFEWGLVLLVLAFAYESYRNQISNLNIVFVQVYVFPRPSGFARIQAA